jgi:hypothetical protein
MALAMAVVGHEYASTPSRLNGSNRENRNHNALAFLRLASIRLMLRKLCNPS